MLSFLLCVKFAVEKSGDDDPTFFFASFERRHDTPPTTKNAYKRTLSLALNQYVRMENWKGLKNCVL